MAATGWSHSHSLQSPWMTKAWDRGQKMVTCLDTPDSTTAHRARQGLAGRPGVPVALLLTDRFLCSSAYFLDAKTGKRAVFEVDVKATKCCVQGKSQATRPWRGRAHFRGHAESAARGWELKRKVRIAAAKTPKLPGAGCWGTVRPDLRERGRDLECWGRERFWK